MSRLVRYLQRWRCLPIPSRVEGLHQPVLVDDLAKSVVCCLRTQPTIGKIYALGGGLVLTLAQMAEQICNLLGRRAAIVNIPSQPWLSLARLAERMEIKLPTSSEQILKLSEDKVFDTRPAHRDFDYRPQDFELGIALLLRRLSSAR